MSPIDICLALSFIMDNCPANINGPAPGLFEVISKQNRKKEKPKTLKDLPEYGICKWEGKWHKVCPVDKETRWNHYLETRRPLGWIDGKPIGGK